MSGQLELACECGKSLKVPVNDSSIYLIRGSHVLQELIHDGAFLSVYEEEVKLMNIRYEGGKRIDVIGRAPSLIELISKLGTEVTGEKKVG